MSYIFRGQLCGALCDDCTDPFAKAVIKLYRLADGSDIPALVAGQAKHAFAFVDAEKAKAKQHCLIAEAETDSEGSFVVNFGDGYDGQAFEVDVVIDQVADVSDSDSDEEPKSVHFTVDVVQPRWRGKGEPQAAWSYCLPSRWWCRVLERLGVWTICGRISLCDDAEKPVPDVRVYAFDRDWLEDDPLGSAVTDASGHFRIHYTTSAFRQGTWLDVELFGGPDVYFRVDSALGAPLLVEPPALGRTTQRSNIGPCFCVDLCLDLDDAPQPGPEPLPFFSALGVYDYETEINSQPTETGLTKVGDRAFFATVRLNGVLSKTLSGQPMEYRFEFREVDNNGAALASWTNLSLAQIHKTSLGKLEQGNPDFPLLSPNPIRTLDIVVGGPPNANEVAASTLSDSQGDWIQVPQQSSSALGPVGYFSTNGNMARVDTSKFATWPTVDLVDPPPALVAGQSATATGQPLVDNRYFAIRMMVRQQGTSGAGTPAGLCRKVAIENSRYRTEHHPAWMQIIKPQALAVALLDIAQLQVHGCQKIGDDLDVLYSAAHPNLGGVSITMAGPGGPYSFAAGGGGGADQHGTAAPSGWLPKDLDACAYIVTLSVSLKLTTGDSVPDPLIDQMAFAKS